jgi:DNA-binding response OmpR family regulator
MARILAVDDDIEMLRLIKTALTRDGHTVDTKESAVAVSAEMCRLYDALLLDVMMPREDGFAFCQRIRGEVDLPILLLTAKTNEAALVRGLGLGADDYIKKPFGIAELRARVNAHLRRDARQPVHSMSRGGVRFDLAAREACVGEELIPFTKSEYAISEHLSEYAGQVFTKEYLYEAVFGYDGEGDASAIAEHIKNIRAKLKAFDLTPIETVWGVGYKWKKDAVL